MTTRHRDFVEQSDELMTDGAESDSSVSDPSESESEGEPWESSAIDSILRNAMFEKRNENSEAKEEPMEEDEPRVESMAGIIVISSDDEEEPMEEPMERNEDRQGVEPTRASGSCGGGGL
ncbi:hypothetical protein Pyn_37988 [Prunus yedoensis var. nudiflora]|uniref:Uncharacterized protein n=1 Tax=Prunus yedoensis var. nudiflora TaxID=2094558 RepID=A0A314Z1P0_PRUYE|nr:hypothetical protein Pyn_37988 [Prunus yedoensis var. nudiflora]